jgi:hypothetical protein
MEGKWEGFVVGLLLENVEGKNIGLVEEWLVNGVKLECWDGDFVGHTYVGLCDGQIVETEDVGIP